MATLDSGEVLEQLVYRKFDLDKPFAQGEYALTSDGEALAEAILRYIKEKPAQSANERSEP